MDGVISEFGPNAIRVAESLWPDFKLPCDYEPKDYGYTDLFSPVQWDAIWTEIKTIPDFWLRQEAFDENVSVLRTWIAETGHEIFFITSRRDTGGKSAWLQTSLWLHNHRLIRPNCFVETVDRAADKKDYIKHWGIEMGLDDLPSTVEAANTIAGHQCFLMSQPWNREANLPRVKSVREFLDIVDRAAATDCQDNPTTPRLMLD